MPARDPRVDAFLRHVKLWREEAALLRAVMLTTDLIEDYKWGQPCYVYGGHNVALIGGYKDSLRLAFFKGACLSDPHAVLEFAGPNSRSAKYIRFRSMNEIQKCQRIIMEYCVEAIVLQQNGFKGVAAKTIDVSLPFELEEAFQRMPTFRDAFYALTPGRQRGYIIYFTSAKQSATRKARIVKHTPSIMAGEGLHD